MKYIVYKTTNLINNYIYIGVHQTDTPYEFDGYLGCGVIINRPSTYKYSKTCFQTAVNQYGVKNFKRETLAVFDTEEEACFVEGLLINKEFLSRSDTYNMILGGINDDTRTTKIYRYLVDSGKFDKAFESATQAAKDSNLTLIQVLRSAKLCYRAGEYQFLFTKYESYDFAKNLYIKNRPVYKYNSNGDFIEEYETQREAEIKNKGSNITNSIKNKKPCKNNFLWSLEKLPSFNQIKQTQKKSIGKYTLDGALVETYDSIKECIEKVGLPSSYIRIGKKYKNYIYKSI